MSDSAPIARDAWLERRPWLALVIIVVAMCVFNFASVLVNEQIEDSWLVPIIVGNWTMEPMLYGAWTALGTGFVLTRLPLAVLCLALSIAALGLAEARVTHLERYEFVTLLVSGIAIYAITAGVLLAVRWFSGLHLEERQPRPGRALRFQFSIGYLLILTTVSSVVTAVLSNMTFSSPEPQLFTLGPLFYIEVIAWGSAYCSVGLAPVLAIAIAMLSASRSKRAMWFLRGGLVMTTMILVLVLASMADEWNWDLLFVVLVQLGGAALAAFAVLITRAAGYRLYSRSARRSIAA